MKNNTKLEDKLENYIIDNKELFYRLAYSYVKNSDDALDIVQESIYKAFLSIDSIRDFCYIKTWFYKIIVNVSIDFIRKRKREIATNKEFLFNNKSVTDKYKDIDLERAIDSLPQNYKAIIILRFFEDLKLSEIADVLDENINTIKTRLYKGLKMLRIFIGGKGDEKWITKN